MTAQSVPDVRLDERTLEELQPPCEARKPCGHPCGHPADRALRLDCDPCEPQYVLVCRPHAHVLRRTDWLCCYCGTPVTVVDLGPLR